MLQSLSICLLSFIHLEPTNISKQRSNDLSIMNISSISLSSLGNHQIVPVDVIRQRIKERMKKYASADVDDRGLGKALEEGRRSREEMQRRMAPSLPRHPKATLVNQGILVTWDHPISNSIAEINGGLELDPIQKFRVLRFEIHPEGYMIKSAYVRFPEVKQLSLLDTTVKSGKTYVYFISAQGQTTSGMSVETNRIQVPK
jgi:hypothetical protein